MGLEFNRFFQWATSPHRIRHSRIDVPVIFEIAWGQGFRVTPDSAGQRGIEKVAVRHSVKKWRCRTTGESADQEQMEDPRRHSIQLHHVASLDTGVLSMKPALACYLLQWCVETNEPRR
jgi:hypothetical protein